AALLLDARAPARVPGARLCDLVRRKRHLQERRRAERGRRTSPRGPPAGRDGRPVSSAPGSAQATQPAGVRRPYGELPGAAAWRRRAAARRDGGAQRGARVRLVIGAVADAPVQPSLRRMRRFGVRADRELGQNFLIDSNILGVIGRAAELDDGDVVLEIGGGLGVLSEYLA